MLDFVIRLGFDISEILIQINLSSIISLFLYYILKNKLIPTAYWRVDIIVILTAAVLGMLLPFNTFGMLPIFFVFLQLGFKYYQVMPILLSNFIFNMSVPYNDPTFVFRTGYKRIMLALFIGIIAGFILKRIRKIESVFRINKESEIPDKPIGITSALKLIHHNINFMGIYMILGVLLNRVFNDHVMYTLTSQVASNSHTAFIPRYMSKFNIVSPGFLMALCIVFALLNISNLSAMVLVFKPKGVVLCVGYYMLWATFLALNMFIR